MKKTITSAVFGCLAVLAFGACSVEEPQTGDFEGDSAAGPAEHVQVAPQALSTCVDVQRGLNGTVEDTYIASAAPGSNNGAYSSIYTGLDSGAEKRTLVKFDLSFVPAGATIDSATLKLYQTYKTGSSTVRVHRSTAAWSEGGATWNNSAGNHDAAVAATIDASSGFGLRTADVTGLVQGWASGSYANDGAVLEEDLTERTVFRSSETSNQVDKPMLTVCYTEQASGVLITPAGHAYGHHGACSGWNGCGDAATCALWACNIEGYANLVSYGAEGPCTGFANCNLFYDQYSIQYNWGNWCEVSGVSEIVCSN